MNNQLSLRNPSSWLVLGCITLLQAINGTRYSIFSECSSTKMLTEQHCHFSYVQLNNLMVASEIGKLFGFLSGVAADYLPASMILIVGLIFGIIGYGVQYLYIAHKIHNLTYCQVLLLNAIAGHSTCWISTYCYVLAIRNFTNSHGMLIAITSSYGGFSGKICTTIIQGIQGKEGSTNSSTSLLLTGLAPTVVGLTVEFINYCLKFMDANYADIDMSAITFLLAIATGVYVVIESVTTTFTHMSPKLQAMILVLVLILPFVIALIMATHKFTTHISSEFCESKPELVVKELEISIDKDERETEQNRMKKVLMERNEHGLKELLVNMNFWLFYLVNASGAILSIVYMINLRRISESFRSNGASFLLEVSSTFGFFGRIFAVLLDWKKSNIPYTTLTVLLMLPMPVAFFLLLYNNIRCFYISTGVLGICSGALNAITASTMYELFGHKNFVAKQTAVLTNIPLGLLLFGCLAALNYQKESEGNPGMCLGLQCYSRIFIIWGFISFFGTFLSFILHLRTQNLYSHNKLS